MFQWFQVISSCSESEVSISQIACSVSDTLGKSVEGKVAADDSVGEERLAPSLLLGFSLDGLSVIGAKEQAVECCLLIKCNQYVMGREHGS